MGLMIGGGADGLARPFKSARHALSILPELIQWNFFAQAQLVIKECAGCVDTLQIHWPPHGSPLGAQGGAAIALDCNGGQMTGGLELIFAAAILELENCTVTKGVSVTRGAELELTGTNTFVPEVGGYIFAVSTGGRIYPLTGSRINIAGGIGAGLINLTDGTAGIPPVDQMGDIVWTDATARVLAGGYLSPFGPWVYNGHTVSGRRYLIAECGVVEGVQYIPGDVPGLASCKQDNYHLGLSC